MHENNMPVPHLTTVQSGPLYHVEKILLNHVALIESWFRQKWQETPPPLTSSVDLRHAGFKLAPVDTNLFPAGFNNLNPDFLPLCVQAVQSILMDYLPSCRNILLLPESHTRNHFYLQSLSVFRDIFVQAGFVVRIGSLDPSIVTVQEIPMEYRDNLRIEPIIRQGNTIELADFKPCVLILNNDLSTGIPDSLQGLTQPILPTEKLGWSTRLKSSHFHFFDEVAHEFAHIIGLDPWLINSYFAAVDQVDFMAQEGLEQLAENVEQLLTTIKNKYVSYGIEEQPFVVVKADNGTYGMSVMMVRSGDEIRQMNRKQRTKMAATKGHQKVNKVIIQEGVYSFEKMPNGSVAEPVVYMMGAFVVGGFYRVHHNRGADENLNAPGMHFERLAFAEPCNMPRGNLAPVETPNRFYAYGVIARLAALAAAREVAAIGDI